MGQQIRRPTGDSVVVWHTSVGYYNYATIDEDPANDVDYNMIDDTEDPAQDVFTFTVFSIDAGSEDISVKTTIRAMKSDDSNAGKVTGVLTIGGIDYFHDADTNLTTELQDFEIDWGSNNPATSTPWTVDQINGVGVNHIEKIGYAVLDFSPP